MLPPAPEPVNRGKEPITGHRLAALGVRTANGRKSPNGLVKEKTLAGAENRRSAETQEP